MISAMNPYIHAYSQSIGSMLRTPLVEVIHFHTNVYKFDPVILESCVLGCGMPLHGMAI